MSAGTISVATRIGEAATVSKAAADAAITAATNDVNFYAASAVDQAITLDAKLASAAPALGSKLLSATLESNLDTAQGWANLRSHVTSVNTSAHSLASGEASVADAFRPGFTVLRQTIDDGAASVAKRDEQSALSQSYLNLIHQAKQTEQSTTIAALEDLVRLRGFGATSAYEGNAHALATNLGLSRAQLDGVVDEVMLKRGLAEASAELDDLQRQSDEMSHLPPMSWRQVDRETQAIMDDLVAQVRSEAAGSGAADAVDDLVKLRGLGARHSYQSKAAAVADDLGISRGQLEDMVDTREAKRALAGMRAELDDLQRRSDESSYLPPVSWGVAEQKAQAIVDDVMEQVRSGAAAGADGDAMRAAVDSQRLMAMSIRPGAGEASTQPLIDRVRAQLKTEVAAQG